MAIFNMLKNSHQQLLVMLSQALDCADADERSKRFRSFAIEMSYHLSAEEQYFFLPLERLGLLEDVSAIAKQKHADFEHQIDTLINLSATHKQWASKVEQLMADMQAYFNCAEKSYYMPVESELSTIAKDSLITSYMKHMDHKPQLMLVA